MNNLKQELVVVHYCQKLRAVETCHSVPLVSYLVNGVKNSVFNSFMTEVPIRAC